jgi:DUF1365 family protein
VVTAATQHQTQRRALSGLPVLPALVEGVVTHQRRSPLRHGFSYRVYQWLVDVDDLPVLPRRLRPFAGFRSGDHLGDPHRSIGENVQRFLALHGSDLGGGRVLMLANARVLGHVFNPLTVYWCLSPDGSLRCVLAEVHNTYGERHVYLLPVDAAGRAGTDKALYVSPFFAVDGRYDLRFTLGPDSVGTSIVLHQGGEAVFAATFTGTPHPLTRRRLLGLQVRRPLMTWRVSALIRLHGVALWLRRLPVVRRQPHHLQEGVR